MKERELCADTSALSRQKDKKDWIADGETLLFYLRLRYGAQGGIPSGHPIVEVYDGNDARTIGHLCARM